MCVSAYNCGTQYSTQVLITIPLILYTKDIPHDQ